MERVFNIISHQGIQIPTTMRYHFTTTRNKHKTQNWQKQELGYGEAAGTLCCLLGEVSNVTTILEDCLLISYKVKHPFTQ